MGLATSKKKTPGIKKFFKNAAELVKVVFRPDVTRSSMGDNARKLLREDPEGVMIAYKKYLGVKGYEDKETDIVIY